MQICCQSQHLIPRDRVVLARVFRPSSDGSHGKSGCKLKAESLTKKTQKEPEKKIPKKKKNYNRWEQKK